MEKSIVKKSKKIYKKIRFDFYQEKINFSENKGNNWSLKNVFDYYIMNNKLETNLIIENETFEIEPNSLFKDGELYFFLISNLRNDLIPAKKKIGKEKEEIKLEDDEYIGEFTGVVYDSKTKIFMIQINKYGVSVSKIEKYFEELKNEYISLNINDDAIKKEDKINLNIILNPEELENVSNSKEIRGIRLKSSTTALSQLKGMLNDSEKNSVKEIDKIVSTFGHVNFEISITADFEADNSLERKEAVKFINTFRKIIGKEKKTSLSVTRRENEDSNVETIDFLLPKMLKHINLSVEPRKSIGRDYLRTEMFKGYSQIKDKLERIIYS